MELVMKAEEERDQARADVRKLRAACNQLLAPERYRIRKGKNVPYGEDVQVLRQALADTAHYEEAGQ